MDSLEHTIPSPSSETIKLIVDNSLLEMEKRMTKSIGDTLADQNKTYLDHIMKQADRLTKVEGKQEQFLEKIKSLKVTMGTVSAVATTLGGLIGFFISQLSK